LPARISPVPDPNPSFMPPSSQPVAQSTDRLGNVPFYDSEAAGRNFDRVSKKISSTLASVLISILADTPDPDSALLLFERLVTDGSADTVRLLEEHPFIAHYAVAIFGTSWYLGETLIGNPDLLHSFLRDRWLERSCSREDFSESLARFRSRSFDRDPSLLLARFKRREYVRIMLRDVLRIAPLAETTAEISALSDVLLDDALREAASALQHRFGSPQHLDPEGRVADTTFSVLSLGKLGGNELNYSSDIDLLFVFGDGQELPEAGISNREYFVRLAQQVTEILSRPTAEGPVFRIDLRLRPQGNEGELAVNLSHALRYYASTAHDWERQALIKVRHSAGDEKLARQFIHDVQPQVYTAEINFAAIKTALTTREKIDRKQRIQGPAGPETINVKIDRGGIRDIEFLVQCLQRVYGGSEPWLRSGGTLFSLHKLHDKGHISGREFHELTSAYSFLRHLEHRLQVRRGQQVHRLPHSEQDLAILQRAMEALTPETPRIDNLVGIVRQRMSAVAAIYQRIIFQQQARKELEPSESEFRLQSRVAASADQPTQVLLEKLAEDAPSLSKALKSLDGSSAERRNLLRFLGSAFSSSERYAAVLRYEDAIVRAVAVFGMSEYLTEILVRYPDEVSTLSEVAPSRPAWSGGRLLNLSEEDGFAARDPVFAYLANSRATHEERAAILRRHFRHCMFTSGARDVTERRPIYSSLADTTAAAEDAISSALSIAGAPSGFAILALGRLGSREFDLLSDADLLFVCDERADRHQLTRCAEELIQIISSYKQEGLVFPVDTRLRPRGEEGELVVTPSQLQIYFDSEARPWEALMYTRLRFVAGDAQLARRAEVTAELLFRRFANDPDFSNDVRKMRRRLELASAPERSIRTAPGAIYDADFLSGFLLVTHGVHPKAGTLRDRLWRCAGAGVLEKHDAATLDHAAELCRTVEHVFRLVLGRKTRWLPSAEHPRHAIEKLTSLILRHEFADGLEEELLRTFASVRAIYDRVLQ
jgi:glutamate-ammonia-ligase adenylyltransferase